MKRTSVSITALLLAACAGPPPDLREVPPGLRVPAGQTLFLETLAVGVQIYRCETKADLPSAFEWRFIAPEASLVSRQGKVVGRHFAGPTWQLADGSSVVGKVRASEPAPVAGAIAWLLLGVESHGGSGELGAATSVQRVRTRGGQAPEQPCSAANFGQSERVSYAASYYFYRASP